MLDVGRHRSDLARAIADVRSLVEQSICSDGSTVLVAELACHKPGCPPRETVIAILNGRGSQTWKVACPAADLSADDVTAVLAQPPDATLAARTHHGNCCGPAPAAVSSANSPARTVHHPGDAP